VVLVGPIESQAWLILSLQFSTSMLSWSAKPGAMLKYSLRMPSAPCTQCVLPQPDANICLGIDWLCTVTKICAPLTYWAFYLIVVYNIEARRLQLSYHLRRYVGVLSFRFY
jgi:hypothetical protein